MRRDNGHHPVLRTLAAAGMVFAAFMIVPSVAAAPGGKPKATLQITPATYNYGDMAVGATSAPQSFSVTNAGTVTSGPLSVSVSGKNASEFPIVAGGSCVSGSTALAPGGSCSISLAFRPVAPTGKKSATLAIGDGPNTTAAKAGLSGNAIRAAALTLSPTSHDYGVITGGHGSFMTTFSVTNGGSASSAAISFSLAGADPTEFVALTGNTNGCVSGTTTLAAGASCTIDAAFSPSADGPFQAKSASLQVGTVHAYEGAPSASLTGTSTPPDQLSISPTSNDFGSVEFGTTSTVTFTVTNTGPQTTTDLHTAVTGTDATEFSIPEAANSCIGPLAFEGTCTLDVTFAPTSAGAKSAALHVWTSKTASDATATLTGTGACVVGTNNGCVTLDGVVVRKLTSTLGDQNPTYGAAQYTLSGSIRFSPTCQAGTIGCDVPNYQEFFTGGGTFTYDNGTGTTMSGTWTARYYDGNTPPGYDSSACSTATIRQLTFVLLFTSGSSSWQTNYIEIRTQDGATGPFQNMVLLDIPFQPTPGDFHTSDMSNVSISC